MFGILFRATLLDLAKVLLVTASVLVTVIAFGAAIKPLSENLLGPSDLMRWMAYATVPMMQFALPFAAAFAGVIVYHRMSSENEVLAMAVSGIPYRRILLPALGMGVLLTVVMVVIVDWGAPTFWRALKTLVANDATRVFVAQVERGEAFRIDKTEIYADEAHQVPPPPETGATQRLVLVGVAAMELGEDGLPRREFTAQYATVDLHRVRDNAVLKVALQDATIFNRGDRAIAGSHIVRPEAVDFGQAIEQGPKGMSFLELLRFRDSMEQFPPMVARREKLLDSLAAADAWARLAADIAARRPVPLLASGSAEKTLWTIEAERLEGAKAVGGSKGGVVLRQYLGTSPDPAKLRTEVTAPAVEISLAESRDGSPPRFDLLVEEGVVRDVRTAPDGKGTVRPVRVADLALGGDVESRSARSNAELLREADAVIASFKAGPSESVRALIDAYAKELAGRTQYYRNEVVARIVQRSSQAMTALLMLLAASIFAIGLRHRSTLVVYLLAFVPAIVDVLLISGGEQMLRRDVNVWGFLVAYSGNALLLVVCIAGWWKLSRH